MHRARDAEAFRPVRGAEFVNGIAVMNTSGGYGKTATRAGIVGHVDLRLGSAAHDMLQAHIRAGGDRFDSIRHTTVLHVAHGVLH
jgi:L-fuconolactonase